MSNNLTVNLSKGMSVDLSKGGLTKFCVGANWGMMQVGGIKAQPERTVTETVKKGGFLGFGGTKEEVTKVIPAVQASGGVKKSLDLDLSAVSLDSNGKKIETIFYGNYRSNPINGLNHSGDDLDGDEEDDGIDNEIISVDTTKIDSKVQSIVFILNAFTSGQDFHATPFSRIRLYKGTESRVDEVVAQYKIDSEPKYAGKRSMILGKLHRVGNKWEFKAIGEVTDDKRLDDTVKTIEKTGY